MYRNMRLFLFVLLAIPMWCDCQNRLLERAQIVQELQTLEDQTTRLNQELERLDLADWQDTLMQYLPYYGASEVLVKHSLMVLEYDEQAEQAKWVGHVISPAITVGQVGRTNDFREDPKIATGSAQETDYFMKYLQADSSYTYDGYGYDRGHLAPSADFRWSPIALSESYFYSNMSPQLPDFNRGIWATLENEIRGYLYRNPEHHLIVFTGPVLNSTLPIQERSPNQLRIPTTYWKVVFDPLAQRMIGYIIPNAGSAYPVSNFASTVDEVERVSGIDFFADMPNVLEDQLEGQLEKEKWLESVALGESDPVDPTTLPRNHFNTLQARKYMGQNTEINVCGKAVSARTSRSGNVLINLDRRYPNQVFTVFIRKEKLINFPYDPEKTFINEQICARGQVVNLSNQPAMFIEDANDLKSLLK